MNRKITAVTLNTFRDYFFTPATIALLIFLLVTPLLCSNLSGDGTAEGKFKVFVTYSFLISSIILTLTNISVSCSLISSEWKKKTLFLLDVKPIKRWQIILGKWLGVLTINFVLIISFLLSMVFSSVFVSNNLKENFPEYRSIFITDVELFPVSAGGISQENPHSFMPILRMYSETRKGEKETYAVSPRESMKWTFKGIKKSSDDLYLSYRFQTAGPEEQTILGYWLIGNRSLSKPFESETNVSKDKIHRLRVPIDAVSDDGELNVVYLNVEPTNISVLFNKSDFKILYPQGNYWINLIRSAVNLLILVTFVCSVGLCFSCITSNLTAVLSTSILISISYMHDFIEIMIDSISGEYQAAFVTVGVINRISYPLLKITAYVLPPLNKVLPHSYIGDFLLIPSSYLTALFVRIVLLGILPLLFVAIIYLSNRELGIPNE